MYGDTELELQYEGNKGKIFKIVSKKSYNSTDLSLLIIGKKQNKTSWSKRAQLFQLNDERIYQCNIKYCINRRLITMILFNKNNERQIYKFDNLPKLNVCKRYAWNLFSRICSGIQFDIYEIDDSSCNIKQIYTQFTTDFFIPEMNEYTLWINENCNNNCFADVSIDILQLKWKKLTSDYIKQLVVSLYYKPPKYVTKNFNTKKDEQIVYKRNSLDVFCGDNIVINNKTTINNDSDGNIKIQSSIKYIKKQN